MEISSLDPKVFGESLKALRLAEGLTQKALGGDRFSHAYISSLESGRRAPSASAVLYLSDRLGENLLGSLVPAGLDLSVVLEGVPAEGRAASRLLELVLRCVQNRKDPLLAASVYRTIGEFHVADHPDLAETALSKAADIYRTAGTNSRNHLGRCLYLLGTVAERRHQPGLATSWFREAASLFS